MTILVVSQRMNHEYCHRVVTTYLQHKIFANVTAFTNFPSSMGAGEAF